jgi:hypothetical protein
VKPGKAAGPFFGWSVRTKGDGVAGWTSPLRLSRLPDNTSLFRRFPESILDSGVLQSEHQGDLRTERVFVIAWT